jgi:hypothetical protein
MASGPTPVLTFPTPQVATWNQALGYDPGDSPAAEAAHLTEELQRLDAAFRIGYLRAGFICMEVRSRGLWRELDFHSFNDWLIHSAPYSRSHCYQAIKDIEELSEIGQHDLLAIDTKNLPLLKKLSSAVRSDPTVLAAAATMPQDAFAGYLATNHPQQHIEARDVRWMLSGSLARLAGEAIDVMMERYDCKTRDEALEAIFAEIINTYGVQTQ